MRFLIKVRIPVQAGNTAAREGKLGERIQAIVADLKPEAVYFSEDKGERTGYLFLDMKDASEIPRVAEPWFLSFNARVEFRPVMIPEDLRKAGPAIEQAVKQYG